MHPNDPTSNLRLLFPYPLVQVLRPSDSDSIPITDTIYKFKTDRDCVYHLSFISDFDYLVPDPIASLSYSLVLELVEGPLGGKDTRIKDTVVYGLLESFKANPNLIISYQCSTADQRGRKRALIFERWFREFAGTIFVSLNYSNDEGVFAAAVFRKDNLYYPFIGTAFDKIYRNK